MYFHLKAKERFNESEVRFFAGELALALAYLHENGFIYRDIKPENILFDNEGHVKLTDFGLAKQLDENTMTNSFCGTPQYLAPEVIKKEGYNHMVDWYGLGILLFELSTGNLNAN